MHNCEIAGSEVAGVECMGFSHRMRPQELVAACLDSIALEGRDGVAVDVLFDLVEPSNDQALRRHVWQLLRRQHAHGVLRFFYEQATTSHKKSKNAQKEQDQIEEAVVVSPTIRRRKRPRSDSMNSTNRHLSSPEVARTPMKREHGMQETVTAWDIALEQQKRQYGDSGESILANIDGLQYEEVMMKDPSHPRIKVVACEELRFRALNISKKAIMAELFEEHFSILEAVGKARIQGMTVTALTKICTNGSVKKLHNCLDTLISYGLVVKRMMIVARPSIRRLNIVHLPRFANDFTPHMFDASAEFESDEQCKKIICEAAETYLQKLTTKSSVLSDLGRDLNLTKRHLETLRSHILHEAKKDEHYHLELFQAVLQPTKRGSIEPKILNCIRYRPRNSVTNGGQVNENRGIQLEVGLLHQIYRLIEKSGTNGTTIVEMRKEVGLPGSKLPYKLVSLLAGTYGLKAESIILGKNKAFRLYVDTPHDLSNTSTQTSHAYSTENGDTNDCHTSLLVPLQAVELGEDAREEGDKDVKPEVFSVRANKALKVALSGGVEVEGTRTRRRNHILERLAEEKIISLSSLRASVFGMEKELLGKTNDATLEAGMSITPLQPSGVGMVDTRSIFRIANELEMEGKLRLLQLPLPAKNVSTKFRALRCVVSPGYEHNEQFIQGFVKNYCRDERVRRIHRNADKNQVVRFHTAESDENGLEDESHNSHGGPIVLKRRKRARADIGATSNVGSKQESNRATPRPIQVEANCETDTACHEQEPNPNEISYRIRRFVSQNKSVTHNYQYRKLGFAYGVMFRCKVFHRYLWKFLHEHRNEFCMRDEANGISIDDDDGDDDSGDAFPKGIVFSREQVLHSMPVHLYIEVFSGGKPLTPSEELLLEEAVVNKRTFDALPESVREKVWSHESQRTAKVLGTLTDLDLIAPHKIGMKNLIKILRAGYTDGRDGILTQALEDNALGGLFRLNNYARIYLDDKDMNFCRRGHSSNGREERKSVNDMAAVRIVGTTEKSYSFSDILPLNFSFRHADNVDQYWEALECLCLEQMVMEVENPRRNEPAVCEVPKPMKTRARRMLKILAWIPKSRKPPPKKKNEEVDNESTPGEKRGSKGIVSRIFKPRKKRRRSENGGKPTPPVDQQSTRLSKRVPPTLEYPEKTRNFPLWTDDHEQKLLEYFIENCSSRWKVAIPQGLQRDNEHIAFRNSTVSRTGFGLVSIARKLGKRKIDVKKRLKEKLMEPAVKLMFEQAKRAAIQAEHPSGIFDEEVAILQSARLTALFRRAVMMIVSPQEEYHPLVAEELISFWTAQEIRLVWRYLWLKNWIVRATEREKIRGYVMSQRLQDSLKLTTLSYPLLLFRQAAEQEMMVHSTLEEITSDSANGVTNSESSIGSQNNDQLFEADFPSNATPGQCAFNLGCQVIGTCSLTAYYTPILDDGADEGRDSEDMNSMASSQKRSLRFLNYKSLKGGSGFAAHLAKQVNFKKPSLLTDSWHVETKIHAVTLEDKEKLHHFEAFSMVNDEDNEGLGSVAFRSFKRHKRSQDVLKQAVIEFVKASGETGMTISELMNALEHAVAAAQRKDLPPVTITTVGRCLNTLVDEGVLLCVNAYFTQRYIVKDHGDVWLLRSFSLVTNIEKNGSLPRVVFEGEKDTLSFPWLKMDGSTNYKFLFAIQRKIISFILLAPGISEEKVYAKMDKLLTLQDTREALALLVEEGLVYCRAATVQPLSLFGNSNKRKQPLLQVVNFVGNMLAYDRSRFVVHYFPHLECIQRFGSIVEDYQNEVAEFQRAE